MRITYLEQNRDLSAIITTICALAGVELIAETREDRFLLAAYQARAGDLLLVDCSPAQPDAEQLCRYILARTTGPLWIIHPRDSFAAGLELAAPGRIRRLEPDFRVFSLLDALRALQLQAELLKPARRLDALSDREQEVLRLVGQGLSDGEIAKRLYLSRSTVKTHVHHAKEKVRLTTRAELIAMAQRVIPDDTGGIDQAPRGKSRQRFSQVSVAG